MSNNKGRGGDNKGGGGGGGNKPSSGGGGGGGIKVAGVTVGQKFGAADIARIQETKPNLSIADIQQKAKASDTKIKASAQTAFRAESQRLADAAKEEQRNHTQEILQDLGILSDSGELVYGDASSNLPGEELVPFANFDLAKQGANLEIQKQIEQIRDAGATERLKYEVDNRIPLAQTEAKGKIDLQKIVNAGYQNIARIERGSDMFRSIMGAFNF